MTFWTCVWTKTKSARRSVKLKYKQLKTGWLWLLYFHHDHVFLLLPFHDISFYWNEANTESIWQECSRKKRVSLKQLFSQKKLRPFFLLYTEPYAVCISYVYRNPKLQNVLMLYLNLSTVRPLSVKTMSLVVPLLQLISLFSA